MTVRHFRCSLSPLISSARERGDAFERPSEAVRDTFPAGPDRPGHAPRDLRIIAGAIDHFRGQVGIRGVGADDPEPSVLEDLTDSVPMPRSAPSTPDPQSRPVGVLHEACGGWLRRDREP